MFERETPKLDAIYKNCPVEYEDMAGNRHMIILCQYDELEPKNSDDVDDKDIVFETVLAVRVREGRNYFLCEEDVKRVIL